MEHYPHSRMNTYYDEGAADLADPCQVRIGDGRIVVSYMDDGPVVYEGREVSEGHFELRSRNVPGKATLHRFRNGQILDGWWHEDEDRGMWRIMLGK